MKKYIILILLSIFFAWARPGYGGEIAIIVNKANAIEDVSFNDLVRIFKIEKKLWDDGKQIYIVGRGSQSAVKEAVLKMVYKMDENELKKFWLTKIYQGDITSFPKIFTSDQSLKTFVRQVPNAVGYIDASYADDSVKILKVDGKLPGENGYKLATE
ncbi:MAG: substrate-binding domain-containing protein [Candidatus Omnitrophica bacterium]|nr:substrate-binding domain-containing protein [Candidatus Omnitrophota bacterium]